MYLRIPLLIPTVYNENPIANNEIWYTSTDGNIVEPNGTDGFGVNIVWNTYENGKGVITFDGEVTKIGTNAFYGCSGLTSITIPDSVTEIGEYAFYGCSGLTSIPIGKGVTEIGYGVFSYCSGLTSIAIPDSVTKIGVYAFMHCSGLTSITIPNSVTEIGWYAFLYCRSLTSITIPNSVTKIGNHAFYNCSGLTSVFCERTTPPTANFGGNSSWYAFNDNATGRKIYVPYQSLDAYKAAEGWSEYADSIVGYDFENDTVINDGE